METKNPAAAKPATKIKLIEDAEATGEVAAAYDFWRARSKRNQMPGILKCFAYRPDFLRQSIEFSDTIHFSEGHLSVKHKEMIASHVSQLNHCPYCLDSHAFFLKQQGASEQCVNAIFEGRLGEAEVTEAERLLLEYAEKITIASHTSTAADVQRLRDVGWKEEQIAEAVYVTAMFAFFNRVANAFGLPPQNYMQMGRLTP